MKKAFEVTIEESVDAQFRLAELAGTVKLQKLVGFALAPLVFLALYALFPACAGLKFVPAGFGTLVFLLLQWFLSEWQLRKQMRKMLVKTLGTDRPVPGEYEVDEQGLAFRKMGQEVRFAWSGVVEINETDAAIELVTKPTGVAMIPKRIFSDAGEAEEWLAFIRGHSHTADAVSAPTMKDASAQQS